MRLRAYNLPMTLLRLLILSVGPHWPGAGQRDRPGTAGSGGLRQPARGPGCCAAARESGFSGTLRTGDALSAPGW